MSRWFRFYSDAVRHPKVARLSDRDFRLWCELLSVAAENDGQIPPLEDLKHLLKRRLDHLSTALDRLIRGSLITPLASGYEPYGWEKRQYKSDTSTDRVRKHRRYRNVSVTPPDTEADTEVTLSKDNGADAPFDPAKVMFDAGVALITSAGKSEGQARSWLGKAKRDHGAEAVIAAIGAAKREGAIDPIPYIERVLRGSKKNEPVVGI